MTDRAGYTPLNEAPPVSQWAVDTALPRIKSSQLGQRVILDVGGSRFACSPDLLRKVPNTYFSVLLSEHWNLIQQADGSIFIDRDPTVFPLILTYLRMVGTPFDIAGWRRALPKDAEMVLAVEAKFYMIPALSENQPIMPSESDWIAVHSSSENRELLFELSRDGVSYEALSQKVTGRQKLVLLAELENGAVLGAYTSVAWNFTSAKLQTDDSAFLIYKPARVTAPSKYPIKKVKHAVGTNAAGKYLIFGERYSFLHDLKIVFGGSLFVGGQQTSYETLPIVLEAPQTIVKLEVWSLDTARQ